MMDLACHRILSGLAGIFRGRGEDKMSGFRLT